MLPFLIKRRAVPLSMTSELSSIHYYMEYSMKIKMYKNMDQNSKLRILMILEY